MVVRRLAIDRARSTRRAYIATLDAWVTALDVGIDDDAMRQSYAAALLSHCAALDSLNRVERALFDAVKDRVHPIAASGAALEMN
jgi:hypothetical protein